MIPINSLRLDRHLRIQKNTHVRVRAASKEAKKKKLTWSSQQWRLQSVTSSIHYATAFVRTLYTFQPLYVRYLGRALITLLMNQKGIRRAVLCGCNLYAELDRRISPQPKFVNRTSYEQRDSTAVWRDKRSLVFVTLYPWTNLMRNI